jgi:hypothetical protein
MERLGRAKRGDLTQGRPSASVSLEPDDAAALRAWCDRAEK